MRVFVGHHVWSGRFNRNASERVQMKKMKCMK